MSSTDTISSTLNQSAVPLTSSSLLKNVTRYEDVQNQSTSKNGAEMGKSDFLTLFTAQLKNQDPLDPVKNEAFVAQLAQFSQLEASTNMQNSMSQLAESLSGERLLSSAALIGKRVAVSDAPAQLNDGQDVGASISLPGDASGIQLNVYDSKGNLVQELIAGATPAGNVDFSWDGTDLAGNRAPAGKYQFKAQAVIDGKTTPVSVSTLVPVTGLSTSDINGAVTLELSSGGTILLSDVKHISD
jgi:flagellar basal-body rod modification protein FlgD